MKAIISTLLASIIMGAVFSFGIFMYMTLEETKIKHNAVQGCMSILPEINPGWYNKCMSEKGYQTSLSY